MRAEERSKLAAVSCWLTPPHKIAICFVALAAALLLLASCATLFSRSELYVDGALYAPPPINLNLQKGNQYRIAIAHEGCEIAYVPITSREKVGWIILDALGLGFPLLIDATTGAWEGLTLDNVNIGLYPLSGKTGE